MHTHTFQGGLAACAVLAAIVVAAVGVRARRCDPGSASLHFVVASVALAIAALIFLGVAPPVVGYTFLCLVLVGFHLIDLLRDEHERRRRVASLVPRPAAEPAPTAWVVIAAASVLMLGPYVLLAEERAAALIVGGCAFVMAAIAWRIASAPVQLHGEDVRYERMRDRALRSRKTGVSAVIAIGSIFAFISFVNSGLPSVLPLQRALLQASFLTWAALGLWVMLYSYRLDRLSRSAS